MRTQKRKKLEAAGWKVGGTREFLQLSDAESQFLEIKLSLVKMLREFRKRNHLTQAQLAKKIRSSQSRVAKMETGEAVDKIRKRRYYSSFVPAYKHDGGKHERTRP